MANTTTHQFTNKRDAVNFAWANNRPLYVDINVTNIGRGQWVVTISSK